MCHHYFVTDLDGLTCLYCSRSPVQPEAGVNEIAVPPVSDMARASGRIVGRTRARNSGGTSEGTAPAASRGRVIRSLPLAATTTGESVKRTPSTGTVVRGSDPGSRPTTKEADVYAPAK